MSTRRIAARGRERGVTLVELMVAVTIGLLLTVVIASMFLYSRRTYGTTDDLSRMQENMRYSQQLLSRIVHHASYMSSPNAVKDDDSMQGAGFTPVFTGANVALFASNGGATGSDTLVVRFQGSGPAGAPDGSVTDCHGREIDSATISTNTFTVGVGANGGNALFCDNGVNGNLEVVPDIENMQLRFGEDTTVPRDGSLERFVDIADVTNWNSVVAVRVALLFRTPGAMANVAPDNRTYDLNGVLLGPFNDLRIRRPLVMTLNLRNRTR